MQLAKFHKLVRDEFGDSQGAYILASHYLFEHGATPQQLLDNGTDVRTVWLALCKDFQVPPDRQLGADE